jgi:hypothetical protein
MIATNPERKRDGGKVAMCAMEIQPLAAWVVEYREVGSECCSQEEYEVAL